MNESGRHLRSISVFDVAEGMRALGSRWMNDSVRDFSRIEGAWSSSTSRMELAMRTKTGAFALGAVRVSGVSRGRRVGHHTNDRIAQRYRNQRNGGCVGSTQLRGTAL